MSRTGTGIREPGTGAASSELAASSPRSPFPAPRSPFDCRQDFPILATKVHGGQTPLIYLDSAATTQKPQAVIDATSRFYGEENANIHRGVYWLSEQATAAYEHVRDQARAFLGAAHRHEIIFTHGTTESVNLVAATFGEAFVRDGDEIVVTELEHHSNLVPWQLMAGRRGARVRAIPVTPSGELDLTALGALLGPRTKLVALTHLSNVLGTINPLHEIIAAAHERGIPVLVDGAQSAPRMAVDVQALDCDFFVCSAHKMYGPTGVGILYGKETWLERLPPYQGGGDMIETVEIGCSTYAPLPARLEAGTPNIAGVIGLGAALGWIDRIGLDAIEAHERAVLDYALRRLADVDGVQVKGCPPNRAGVVSFVMNGIHPHDIATILDASGIAIRGGHHCAQPLMARLGVAATARASFAAYTTLEDIDALVNGLHEVRRVFP